MYNAFADLSDVMTLTGKSFTTSEQNRLTAVLQSVSDILRIHAKRAGMDLDAMAAEDSAYASLLKSTTVDIAMRNLRQSLEGDPMSQYSQSALGYSVSGTYAVPGGGIGQSVMRNDLKTLGIKRQRIGKFEPYGGD